MADQAPTTSTVYQTNIPAELMPYAAGEGGVLPIAQSLVANNIAHPENLPQTQVAGFGDLQNNAFAGIGGMQPSYANYAAEGLAGLAGSNQFTGQNVNQFMSPYIQDVINQQQQGAIRDYSRQLPGLASNATRAGALGGTRSALMESEAQRGLQQQLGSIQATGMQNAFQNAQQQFNTQNQTQLAASGLLNQIGQNQYAQQAGILQAQLGAGNLQQQQQQNVMNNQYQNMMNAYNLPNQNLDFMSGLIRGTPTAQAGQYNYAAPPTAASQLFGTAGGLYNLFGGSTSPSGSTQPSGKKEGGSIKGYKEGGIVTLAEGGDVGSKMGALQMKEQQVQQQNPAMPPNQVAAQVQQGLQAIPGAIPWQNAFALMQYNKAHPMSPQAPSQDSVVVGMAKQVLAANAMQGIQGAGPMPQGPMPQAPQMPQGGVAGLPADNVGRHYASGGIVAFEGGGPTGFAPDLAHAPMTMPSVGGTMTYQGIPEPTELEKLSAWRRAYTDPDVTVDPDITAMSKLPGGAEALRKRYEELLAQAKARGAQNRQSMDQQGLAQLASHAGVTVPTQSAPAPALTVQPPEGGQATSLEGIDLSKYYSKDPSPYAGSAGGSDYAALDRSVAENNKYLKQLWEEGQAEEKPKSVKELFNELRALNPDEKTDATHRLLDAIDRQEANIAANTEENRRMARAKAFFTVAQKGTPAAGGLLGGIAAGGADYADSMSQINKDTEAAQQKMLTARYEAAKAAENERKDDFKTAVSEYQTASRDWWNNRNMLRQTAVALQGNALQAAVAKANASGLNQYYRSQASDGYRNQQDNLAMLKIQSDPLLSTAQQQGLIDKINTRRLVLSGAAPSVMSAGIAAQEKSKLALQADRDYMSAKAIVDDPENKYSPKQKLAAQKVIRAKLEALNTSTGGLGGLSTVGRGQVGFQ